MSVQQWVRRVTHGVSPDRVRATWRGILPWAVGFGVQLPTLAIIGFAIRSQFDLSELGGGTIVILDIGLLGIASGIGLLVAITFGTWLDKRSLAAYGISVSPSELRDWVAGIVIGSLTYAVPTAVFLQLGRADVTAAYSSQIDDLMVIAIVAAVAIVSFGLQTAFEEFVFRGVMLKNFAEGLVSRGSSPTRSAIVALLASSLVFGASHIITQTGGGAEGRSIQLVVSSTLLGLLWGGTYVLTGQFAVPFGLHLGHNLWAAMVLQPTEVAVRVPALGQVAYSVSRYDLVVGQVIVGASCVLMWLYLTRDEVIIEDRSARQTEHQ
ncbi:CPBP family intramembrane glutamic endopeptidase [Halobellus ordinarius]|uniref:CPBP family intramembrane glutamic endopeptidase n=1 Tax=Halobellus ordinarius TaxID=3075120 RepID=UPI002880550F|nr:type II CAAX endopeptidase family protein [Halobellus sp. ZY16]